MFEFIKTLGLILFIIYWIESGYTAFTIDCRRWLNSRFKRLKRFSEEEVKRGLIWSTDHFSKMIFSLIGGPISLFVAKRNACDISEIVNPKLLNREAMELHNVRVEIFRKKVMESMRYYFSRSQGSEMFFGKIIEDLASD